MYRHRTSEGFFQMKNVEANIGNNASPFRLRRGISNIILNTTKNEFFVVFAK